MVVTVEAKDLERGVTGGGYRCLRTCQSLEGGRGRGPIWRATVFLRRRAQWRPVGGWGCARASECWVGICTLKPIVLMIYYIKNKKRREPMEKSCVLPQSSTIIHTLLSFEQIPPSNPSKSSKFNVPTFHHTSFQHHSNIFHVKNIKTTNPLFMLPLFHHNYVDKSHCADLSPPLREE
jgi:hypothetical protein